MTSRRSSLLHAPVQYLKGVGPRRAERFERLDVRTGRDLLYHLPHRYEDATTVTPIASLETGDDATTIGHIGYAKRLSTRPLTGVDDAPMSSPEAPNRTSFPMVRLGDSPPVPPAPLVANFLDLDSLTAITGPSGSGKTHLAAALSVAVSGGVPFYGRSVQRGAVVYIAGEGYRGLGSRLHANAEYLGLDPQDLELYVSEQAAQFCDPDSAKTVREAVEAVARRAGNIRLIVIDTLARNFGGDENSTKDMNSFISQLDAIRRKYGCAILVIHHTGHSNQHRGRGSTAFHAALDAEWIVKVVRPSLIRLDCSKVKDGAPRSPIAFHIRPYTLADRDACDSSIPSAVLEETFLDSSSSLDNGRALGRNQRRAIETLRELLAGRDGDDLPVALDAWRSACEGAGLDRRRFWEAKKALEERGMLVLDGNSVTLLDE